MKSARASHLALLLIFLSGRLVFTAVTIPPIIMILFYVRDYIVLPSNVTTCICALLSLVTAG